MKEPKKNKKRVEFSKILDIPENEKNEIINKKIDFVNREVQRKYNSLTSPRENWDGTEIPVPNLNTNDLYPSFLNLRNPFVFDYEGAMF